MDLPGPDDVLGSTHPSHLLPSPPSSPSALHSPPGATRVLYLLIKVLYARHTLLERIAASKALQSEGRPPRVMNTAGRRSCGRR